MMQNDNSKRTMWSMKWNKTHLSVDPFTPKHFRVLDKHFRDTRTNFYKLGQFRFSKTTTYMYTAIPINRKKSKVYVYNIVYVCKYGVSLYLYWDSGTECCTAVDALATTDCFIDYYFSNFVMLLLHCLF